MMKFPNFLIIGAAKSGTTSLYHCLKQHPQIYMSPVKEPNFFALEGEELNYPQGTVDPRYLAQCITTKEEYEQQFQEVSNEIAVGEASPIYLYHPQAPIRIKNYIPEVKIIVILRNPIERAYSNFLHHVREGLETVEDFSEALELEEYRIKNNWWWGFHYLSAGFYSQQLKRYYDQFDQNQIRVYLYDELKENSSLIFDEIFKFLGVDPNFKPENSTQYNVAGIPRNKLLNQLLSHQNLINKNIKWLFPSQFRKKMRVNLKNMNLVKTEMSAGVRLHLIETYKEEIGKLEELLQRDLSKWLVI